MEENQDPSEIHRKFSKNFHIYQRSDEEFLESYMSVPKIANAFGEWAAVLEKNIILLFTQDKPYIISLKKKLTGEFVKPL